MTPPNATEEDRSSLKIEQDIRDRRRQMDSTLDELGERLTLRSLVHSALEWWDAPVTGPASSTARKACLTLGRQIKHHPMPSLLIGSGVAWLLSEAADHDDDERTSRRPSAPDKESGLAHAKDAAVEAIGDAKEKVVEVAERIHESADHFAHETMARGRETAKNVGHRLVEGYRGGAEKFAEAADDYPLAIGAAFAALGVLAGLALPRTRKEDELMGEQSDHLVEAAKEKGEHLLEAGKAIGERVAETVKEEVAGQGLTGASLESGLEALREKAGQVIEKAKDEVVQAVRDEGLDVPTDPSDSPPPPQSAPSSGR